MSEVHAEAALVCDFAALLARWQGQIQAKQVEEVAALDQVPDMGRTRLDQVGRHRGPLAGLRKTYIKATNTRPSRLLLFCSSASSANLKSTFLFSPLPLFVFCLFWSWSPLLPF